MDIFAILAALKIKNPEIAVTGRTCEKNRRVEVNN